jgi:hypothetical protein
MLLYPKAKLATTVNMFNCIKLQALNYKKKTFHIVVFLLIIILIFSFSSCRKESSNNNIVAGTDTAGFSQQGLKLVGLGASAITQEGSCTSLSSDGNTLAIGGQGGVWIFTRNNDVWTQQGNQLLSTDEVANSFLGGSISLSSDGNTLAVGGPFDNGITEGCIWIFIRNNGIWSQQGNKLVGTGAIGYAYQGGSVALSADGNTLAEGGPTDNKSIGAVWIFRRNNNVWIQQGNKLIGTGLTSCPTQGSSVSLSSDGNIVAFGSQEGIWIFKCNNNLWAQQGDMLTGTDATSIFQGESVSLSSDGNTVVSGAPGDNNLMGATWIFTCNNGIWSQQGNKLVGTGIAGISYQGNCVSLSSNGNVLAIGGYEDNNEAGATWVFTRANGTWVQQGDKLVGTGAIGNSVQGTSVSLSGDGKTLVSGGSFDNNSVGAVWVFNRP